MLSRGFRRSLLVIAIIVFAAASYVVILYARGYTYSFNEWDFVFTGALTLDANEQADVIIDDEKVGTTSVLTHEFSRGRLLPGTYTVRLEREEFSEWSKSVIIQEGLVTDFPHVIMLALDEERASRSRGQIDETLERSFPQRIRTPSPPPPPAPEPEEERYSLISGVFRMQDRELARGVRGYAESQDGKKLMWWTRNEVVVMWLEDTEYQPFRLGGERETITRLTTSIDRAGWWPESHHIAIRSGTRYRVVELDNRGGTNIIEL